MQTTQNSANGKEEAAAVKALIRIKKGGEFLTVSDMIQSSGKQSGLSKNEKSGLQAQVNALAVSSEGKNSSSFQGYTDGETIVVQINPTSYSIQSKSSFKAAQIGELQPDAGTYGTFGPSEPSVLSVKLFYDTTLQADYLAKLKSMRSDQTNAGNTGQAEEGTVNGFIKFDGSEDLNQLYLNKLLYLTRTLKGLNTPAMVCFEYGSTAFEGYVNSVSIEYKRFNKTGEVTRAEVSLSIEESSVYALRTSSPPSAKPKSPNLSRQSRVRPNHQI